MGKDKLSNMQMDVSFY